MNAAISVGMGGAGSAPGTGSIGFCNSNTITNNIVYESGAHINNGNSGTYGRGGGTDGFICIRGVGNIVRGNTLRDSTRTCVSIIYGGSNVVDSNIIENTGAITPLVWEDAISISSSKNIISNNIITNPGRYCVSVSGTANQIINNDFTGPNTILNQGTGTIISGNY
jgi:hypothetical protein